jgi:hypothetical protein
VGRGDVACSGRASALSPSFLRRDIQQDQRRCGLPGTVSKWRCGRSASGVGREKLHGIKLGKAGADGGIGEDCEDEAHASGGIWGGRSTGDRCLH